MTQIVRLLAVATFCLCGFVAALTSQPLAIVGNDLPALDAGVGLTSPARRKSF